MVDRERVWVETSHDTWVGGEVLSRQGNVTLVLLETGEVMQMELLRCSNSRQSPAVLCRRLRLRRPTGETPNRTRAR